MSLPDGTLTFLLTDVEASTPSWDADADRADIATQELDAVIRDAVGVHGGSFIKSRGEGDSAFAVFLRASDAITAACAFQRDLYGRSMFRVRAALHTGEARLRDDDYFGVIPARTARLRALAHGGQTLVSRVTADVAEPELPSWIRLMSLGAYSIRDWPRVERVFGVIAPGIESDFPPLRVWGEASRALMTVVVVDEVSSQARAAELSEPTFVSEQRSRARHLRTTFHEHRGAFLKLMGDGCLAAFDDPMNALSFAQATSRGWRRPVRIGVHAGLVELVEDDIAGSAIYRAYALTRDARPGIVVTRTFADLVSNHGVTLSARDGETFTIEAPSMPAEVTCAGGS